MSLNLQALNVKSIYEFLFPEIPLCRTEVDRYVRFMSQARQAEPYLATRPSFDSYTIVLLTIDNRASLPRPLLLFARAA